MEIFWVIAIVLGVFLFFYSVTCAAKKNVDSADLLKATIDELKKLGFTPSLQEIFIADKTFEDHLAKTGKSDCLVKVCGIACDSEAKKIATISSAGLSIHGFDELLSCSTIIDNETMTSTSRGSQVAGAIVGGVLLGGVGALVGALTSQKKSQTTIKNVQIRLVFNSLDNPTFILPLMPPHLAKDAVSKATKIEDYFAVVLRQNQNEEGTKKDTKICPFCAEEVKLAAIVCKHCGKDLPTKEA